MKLNTLMGLCLAALLIGMPGCTTTESGKKVVDVVTAEKLAPILSGSVAGAVVYAYTRNTQTEVYVATIRAALYEFAISEDLSATALQAKLYNLPIPELKKPEAQLIIAPLLATYKGFADPKVKEGLKKDPGLKLLIEAMIAGCDQGLAGIAEMKKPVTMSDPLSDQEALSLVFKALNERLQQSGG